MGALANSASLLRNTEWRDWITAAASFVAAEVYQESPTTSDYVIRRRLAVDVLTQPDLVTARLLTLVSTTQNIAVAGAVPSDAHEPLVIARIRVLWTPVAQSYYPPET